MKKFGLVLLGGIAAIVLLANFGPLVGLAVSLVILYYSYKRFIKSETTGSKIIWGVIGIIALSITVSNLPAIIGVVAAYILYTVYKKWQSQKSVTSEEQEDPFTSFEKQWAEFSKN